MLTIDLSALPPGILVGTSSFSSADWCGSFYPANLAPSDFLTHYARTFTTVEIDATWHALPSRRTFEAWAEKVPEGFIFSLKAPKTVTHERYLNDCEDEWNRFFELTDLLGDKRGPILLQFPYVAKGKDPQEYRTGAGFLDRLGRFLPKLSSEGRYVVEVRNRNWVSPPLLDLLKRNGVALALVHYYTMPSAAEIMARNDPVTADFSYLRFLGHHRLMDESVARAREKGERDRDWGEVLVDRTSDTRSWIPPVQRLLERTPQVFLYFNNHYAGFAPGSVDLFVRLWKESKANPV